MRMTPVRLMLLRLYNMSAGRFAVGDRLFRLVTEQVFIWRRKPANRYTASAGLFDIRDLDAEWESRK